FILQHHIVLNNSKKYYPGIGQSFALLLILLLIAIISNIALMFIDRLDMTIHPAIRQLFLYLVPMTLTCWIGFRQRKNHDNTNKILSVNTVPSLTLILVLAGTICLSSVIDITICLMPLPESSMDKILEELI